MQLHHSDDGSTPASVSASAAGRPASLGSVRDAYDNWVRQIREFAKIIVAQVAESDSR